MVIPAEYQEVEYLESTGTQWIDTDYTPNALSKIAVKMSFKSTTPGQLNGISNGVGSTNSRFAFGLDIASSEQTSKWYCGIGDLNTWNGYNDTETHIFTIDAMNKEFTVDNVSYSVNYSKLSTTGKIYVLARNRLSALEAVSGVLYFIEIYQNDDLVQSFVPCYRKSDNKPGMYDTVTGTFYTNQGSGEFVVGRDVSRESLSMLWLRRKVMMALASGVPFKKVHSITLTEDIEFTTEFYNLINAFDGYVGGKIYVFRISGNTSDSEYRGVAAIVYCKSTGSLAQSSVGCVRPINLTTTISMTYNFYMTANSVIDIYEMQD